MAALTRSITTWVLDFWKASIEKRWSSTIEDSGLRVQQESPLKVLYRDQNVGNFFVDLLVDDELIVELKSVEQLGKAHEAQLVNYLVATGIDVGLLINFGSTGVDVKRKYRTAKEKQ